MKNIIIQLTIIAVLATTIATSLGQFPSETFADSEDISNDSEKDIADAKKELQKALSIFKLDYQKVNKDFQLKHKNNEIRIADLKTEIMQLNVKDKSAMYQKEVSDLAQKNNKLKMKLSKFTDEEVDEWTSFKNKFNHDVAELSKALKDVTINQ